MRCVAFLLLAMLLGSPAYADALIRSDLPLSPREDQSIWPANCEPQPVDALAMCSRFSLGDWEIRWAGCSEPAGRCGGYAELSIFSVIDGFYTYAEGKTRGALAGHGDPALIFKLEPGTDSTLYALQIGFRGGSRYVLPSVTGGDARIDHASILDTGCPALPGVHARGVHAAGFFREDYCVVDSMAALIAVGREALNRAPAGTMSFVGSAKSD